jgi:hypothetical protein
MKSKKPMKLVLDAITLVVVIFFLGVTMFTLVSSIPDVYVSHSSGECVKVVSDDPSLTCDNKPARYNQIWVK